jgi:hypothetical protein
VIAQITGLFFISARRLFDGFIRERFVIRHYRSRGKKPRDD